VESHSAQLAIVQAEDKQVLMLLVNGTEVPIHKQPETSKVN